MRIDRYELFGPFATGGMASVHFGKLFASAGFQRVVAIKVPHAQFISDADFRAMFLDEARIVARIRSPHVVATLDIIEEGKTLYQVMEYANGPSLSSVIKSARAHEEPIPIPIVLSVILDTLEGLHAAHEVKDDSGQPLNVVHRDVSPQNILVTDDGVIKVIDFGIASAAGRLHLTQPGNVKGKVSYMAPEQVDGRPLDRRADVYAVGIVLYETLTGLRPFTGEDFSSTALMHVLNPAPDPRTLRADIPPELAAIVARALEKKAKDRFPTARAMADALLALPTARAPARELAKWLAEGSRDFFLERAELIAALPNIEDTEIEIDASDPEYARKSQQPTRLDINASPPRQVATVVSGEEETPRPRRWTFVALALLSMGGAGFFAFKSFARQPKPDVVASVSAPPSFVASASPLPSTVASVPASNELTKAPPATTTSSASARPHATTKTNSAKISASSAPSASSPTAIPQAPCCAGDLRIRFTDCSDNCPSTAPHP